MASSKMDLIAQDIASKIKHHQFEAGEYLPSESQLTSLYGSSRGTVRKALDQLNALGMIQKIKGKGSIVLNLEKYSFPISGISSFTELNKALAMKAQTKVLVFKRLDDLPPLFKEKFPEQIKQAGFYVERLRLINGEPEVLDCDYLFSPPVISLPKSAAENSIFAYLEKKLGINISYATKVVTVERIKADLQQKLNLRDGLAVLVASHNFMNDTTPVQLTLSFHNPSKFKFVDFARRQTIKL